MHHGAGAVAYIRERADDCLYIAVNAGDTPAELPLPEGKKTVSVPPGGYVILDLSKKK